MAKNNKVSLPMGQGGLLGGFTESLKTKIMFKPEFVIFLSIAIIIIEFLLHNYYK